MKNIKKFFVVVTSLMLVFAMTFASCEQETVTKTEYVNTGGGGGGNSGGGYTEEQIKTVQREADLLHALNEGSADNPVTVYVLNVINLTQPLTLKSGQSIVVAKSANDAYGPVVKSTGKLGEGPLFDTQEAPSGVTPALNIKANLTLASGSSLTVAKGAAVNVQTPAAGKEAVEGTLLVKKGATVGVGVNVSGSNLESATGVSNLNVASKANLLFETDAVLAVGTSADSSKVKLADATSKIDLVGVKLAVVQEGGSAPTATDATVFSTTATEAIIEIPAGAKAAVEVEVYTAVDTAKTDAANSNSANVDSGLTSTVNEAAETATTSSPAKKTDEATGDNGVQTLLSTGDVAEVTYTGTTALGTVSVPANKTLIIKSAVPDGSNKITLASGAVLEIASGASIDFGATGTLAGATGSTVTNNGTIKTATIDANQIQIFLVEAKGKIESSGDVTALPTVTVQSGTELTISGAITNTGTFTNDGVVTLSGTFTNSGSGTYNKASKGTFNVSNTAALNSAVAFNVPTISLNEAFYEANTTNLIVIGKDAGTRTSANAVVIKGLGTATAAPTLNVGVQIANDYITLQDVKIAVTETAKAKKTFWMAGSHYYSAVFLGRSESDSSLHVKDTDDPVHNVSLLNSDISITTATGFTAGVWVDGNYNDKTVDPPANYYYNAAENITIKDNTISATGPSSTQGIALSPYHSSITITGNTITAQHSDAISTTAPGKPFDGPTSAIYIRTMSNATDSGSATPNISRNTIHNGVAASGAKAVYSFYFNAYDKWTASSNQNGPTYDGIAALRNYKFGNYETTWALPNNDTSVYKELFNALIANITGKDDEAGFAAVGSELSGADYAFEQYKIADGKVTSISVHGFHLNPATTPPKYDSAYAGAEGSKGNRFDASTADTITKDYGSFEVENGARKASSDGQFWFTYQTQDDDWSY
jgi:hypothetical protein